MLNKKIFLVHYKLVIFFVKINLRRQLYLPMNFLTQPIFYAIDCGK